MRHLTRGAVAFALVGLAMSLSGCYTLSAGTTPSTIPLPPDQEYTKVGDFASGRAFGITVLGFPLSEVYPTRYARDRAVRGAGADGLIDAQVDTRVYNLYLAIIIETQVSGVPIKLND